MKSNARFLSVVILAIAVSIVRATTMFVPRFIEGQSGCSVSGHLLSCYRSNRAAHILKNITPYVSDGTIIREISVIESGLTDVPDEIWTSCPSLQSLDLSGNNISSFSPTVSHTSLRYLNFSRNGAIGLMDLDSVFSQYPSLVTIDLSSNEILSLGQKKPLTTDRRTVIVLSDSNVTCTEDTSWFLHWASTELGRPNARIVVDDARCTSGPMEGVPLAQSYASLLSLKHETCTKCVCFFKPSLHVNCSARGLTAFPKSLPTQTKVVDLEHNDIREISLTPEWTSVIYLHLKDNRIESLNGLEGNVFARNIRSLNLESNRLREVQARVLKQLNVDQISLNDNPWRCDCNAIAFQLWLQDHSPQIRNMDQIKCATPPTAGKGNGIDADIPLLEAYNPVLAGRTLYKILRSDLCPQPIEGAAHQLYDYVSCAMAFLTIFIIFKLVYDWWWQRRTGKLPRFFKLNV